MNSSNGYQNIILSTENLSIYYGQKKAIQDMTLQFVNHHVTAIIGPSGCGKSTLLRAINRMHEFNPNVRTEGKVIYKGEDLYDKSIDPADVRRRIGMVFQKPNPFPKSIYQNIIWGPKINGLLKNPDELVEKCLKQAALWDEVKDRLHSSALDLSGGQQQRLCIARAIAMNPELILMDEPCSALDPKSTIKIEDLITDLKKDYSIIIVTHNMQQASRVSDETVFLYEGQLIETDTTTKIFTKPQQKRTEDYITGRFG